MMAAPNGPFSPPARKLRKVSHSLMKSLNKGNPTIEQHATRKTMPVTRICLSNPPSSSRSMGVGGVGNCAGPEKQQALEQRMVERVKQGAHERERRPYWSILRDKDHGRAQAHDR